jgi:hypothetical protein
MDSLKALCKAIFYTAIFCIAAAIVIALMTIMPIILLVFSIIGAVILVFVGVYKNHNP